MHFPQGSPFHGEILGVNEHRPSVDRTVARHHPVSGQIFLFLTEVGAAMFHKFIQFYKTSLI